MRLVPFVALGALFVASPALAQHSHDHRHAPGHHGHNRVQPGHTAPAPSTLEPHRHHHGVDTESLFGFVTGSDIGEKGERHLSLFYGAQFGKRGGIFQAHQPKLEIGYNPTDRLHVALELWADHFRIRDVPGLDDQNRWGGGIAAEFKMQLVKRGTESPVGVALVAAPHYSNSEHHSGEAAQHYALELKLAADTELVKDRLFAVFNLLYEPERVRAAGGGEWEKESLFGISGAVMGRIAPGVFLGGELQYFRKYEGYFLNEFHGHALYAGPALTVKTGDHSAFTISWAAQVAGNAAGEPDRLDLEHFERHRVRARWSTHF